MKNRVEVWIGRDTLMRAIDALYFQASKLREQVPLQDNNYPKEWKDSDIANRIWELEHDAENIRNVLQYQEPKDTEDEQLSKIKKLVEEEQEKGWFTVHQSNYADQVRAIIKKYEQEKNSYGQAFAALVENLSVDLRAMEMIAETVLQAHTHKVKNSKLMTLKDIIENTKTNVMGIDTKNTTGYTHLHWNESQWNFRKLAQENYVLKRKLEQNKESDEFDEIPF
jgi:hypothetical protein